MTLFSQQQLTGISVGRVAQDIPLGIAHRVPVLRILRCYCDGDGNIFEISVSHHPGDRFAYSMHIDVDS